MPEANTKFDNGPQKEESDGISRQQVTVQPDEFFNFELISFQVEGTVFRVITRGLDAPGSAFEAMLSLPKADHGEGSSNEKPILLEGVQERHFRAFLRVLYGDFEDQGTSVVDLEDWLGVLSLSTMWNFSKIRAKAVAEASKLLSRKSILERLHLGRKYMVTTWTKEALVALVQKTHLGAEEWTGSNLTFVDCKTIAKIYGIREGIYRQPFVYCANCNALFPVWLTHPHSGIYGESQLSDHTPLIGHQEAVALVDQAFAEELDINQSRPS